MILRTVRNDLNIVEVLLFDDFSLCPAEGSMHVYSIRINSPSSQITRPIGGLREALVSYIH